MPFFPACFAMAHFRAISPFQGSGTSCLEDLRKIHQLISEGQLRKEAPATPKASLGTSASASASALGKKLIQLLDRALKTPSLYETLFPLSAIKRPLRGR